MNTCALCGRELAKPFDEHHLIPKSYKGKEVVLVHRICHDKIHHTFTEYELAHTYNSVELLQNDPIIASFIKWVKNKPTNFYNKTKDTIQRNRKR
jgi:hypothetical protein